MKLPVAALLFASALVRALPAEEVAAAQEHEVVAAQEQEAAAAKYRFGNFDDDGIKYGAKISGGPV
ncbi:hypothetical protein E4U42_003625 [Claviceps africana]|uniref:Uncharacterized protein n=1 Tax=Claviceps africana TaxID=83212 RepID=A0A8K0JEU0_9HYPO|nr:hypothetical protein E4U42_003625 [Claviceps africana]